MSNFFVSLFINNRVYQYKIDELIQNSTNGYISENLVFGSKDIYFPLLIQEECYCLHNKSSSYKIFYEGKETDGCVCLKNGDFFLVQKDQTVYSALVIDCAPLSLGAKVCRLGDQPVFIGRAEDMNVVIDVNGSVSRKCAAIRRDENGNLHVEDLSGKTGIYVNGHRETSKKLAAGDEIYIMGTTMICFPTFLILPYQTKTDLPIETSFDQVTPVPGKADELYVRTPRIFKSEEDGRVVIDPPTAPQETKDIPFILTAGPSLTMSLAMLASLGVTVSNALNGGGMGSLVTSSVMAVSMLAGALLWPSLMRKYNKSQQQKAEQHRREKYAAYLADKEKEIRVKYERNVRILNEMVLPSPEKLSVIIEEKNRRLWERSPKDDDFLKVRLGIGEADSPVEIQAPNKTFTLEDDPLLDDAIALKDRYKVMKNVPLALSLAEKKVVGVVGQTTDVLKVMVTNIVASHASDEVKLVLLYNAADINELQWANDLPHTWSNDKKQRFVATNRSEAQTLLAALDEMVAGRETEEHGKSKGPHTPHFVVLVLDDHLIEDIPFRRHLIREDNRMGLSTVFFGKRFSNIPKECVAIIQKEADLCGMYIKNENQNRFVKYVPDEVSDALIRKVALGINSVAVKVEKTTEGVPDRVTFLDMFRVGNVEALEITNHWKTNVSEKSLAAPIGIKAGGETFHLDIHEKFHGCHGLVAGTTGSGKSEFLQAYILSMMINYSPNEAAFVLVDFKGGDMARPFLKAPHLAATISNLSGNTLHRALISLEAEVKNRQNIFNRSAEKLGVDKIDINSYHKFFKDKKLTLPLPHLIIVIDEFAQLKSQHPEFMAKLIDIAQVGRSLGIHLILATQRPSGVVDPQIWSNSKFKVCLKVLDKQDSMDMINRPEAALIKQPGRAFVQVGYDEIFEQIQSGYSGADYVEQAEYIDEDSISVNLVNWPAEKLRTAKKTREEKKSDHTQLEEVVSVIAAAGESLSLRAKQLWLPPLAAKLLLENCEGATTRFEPARWDTEPYGEVVCGIADLPEKQAQRPFGFDFLRNGHLAIYGASGTGKSTLIQTILYSMTLKYSPAMLNLFLLDYDGNSLASLAAIPHCAKYVADDEKGAEEMLATLQSIISSRHELFAKNHCASYESYISSTGDKLPMILFVLDNYSAFREKAYRAEDTLVQIIAAARSCGIFLIVTGNSKGAIHYKLAEQIPSRVVLNMNDTGAYRDVLNVSVPIVPEAAKGRALTLVDGKATEVQFAVPLDTDDEAARTAAMQSVYALMREHAEAVTYAVETPVAYAEQEPESYVPTYTESKPEAMGSVSGQNCLVVGADVKSGENKGFDLAEDGHVFIGTRGNDNAVCGMVSRFAKDNPDKVIFLISEKEHAALNGLVETIDDIDAFVEELVRVGEAERKKAILVIDGFCDFFDRISDEALEKLESFLKNDRDLRIVTFDDMSRLTDYRDAGLFVLLVRTERGAIVGGGIDDGVAASITNDIYNVPVKAREKVLNGDCATVYCGHRIAYVITERG